MKTLIQIALIAIMLLNVSIAEAQVTDSDIVKALLGKSYFKAHPTLDSMKVWYYLHIMERKAAKGYIDTKPKVYSIENGDGTVKNYVIRVTPESVIDEITINFRHDVKAHVLEISKMATPTDYHNGIYSTDMTYKAK